MADDRKSLAESLFRGFRQGGSLGYSDELGAVEQAGLGALTGQGDFQKIYNDAVSADRSDDAAAREAHPIAYGASEFAGGMVPAAVGGMALKVAAPAASLASKAALQAAVEGGVTGAGRSEAPTAMDVTEDAGWDALKSLGTVGAAHGVVKGVGAGYTAAQKALAKMRALDPEKFWGGLNDASRARYVQSMGGNEGQAKTIAFVDEVQRRKDSGEPLWRILGMEKPAPPPEPPVGFSPQEATVDVADDAEKPATKVERRRR